MESLLTGPLAPLAGTLGKLTRQRTSPLILELDLTEGVIETRPPDPLSAIMTRHQPTITDLLAGLKAARTDDRVKALVVRAAGKPTWAWAETFGEFSAGNVPYYLATAFDTVYLQPSGDLGLTGMAIERVFLRGALDKLGVTMQVGARHEYKSAAEQLTEHGFSGPAREATERIAESVTSQLAEAVAERGKVSAEEAGRLVNGGPYLADQALAAGLVDALGYRDEVYAALRKQVGNDPVLLYLGRYQRSRELANRARQLAAPRQPTVALIQASGAIRHCHGLGQHDGRAARRDRRSAHQGRRAACEQPGRLLGRLRHDLARGGQDPQRRQAGRGLDERRRGVRRLPHLGACRRDRRPGRHRDRLDRRAGRQAGAERDARQGRRDDRLDRARRPRRDVLHLPAVQQRGVAGR